VSGVDAGTEAGHVRGDVPDAHRVEGRPGAGVAVRGIERRAPAGTPASPAGVRELLGEAGEVPGIQVQAQITGIRDVHHVRVPLPRPADLARQDDRAAGYPLVPAAPGGRGAVYGNCEQGRGGTLAHLDPGGDDSGDAAAIGDR